MEILSTLHVVFCDIASAVYENILCAVYIFSHEEVLKETLAARGFVSDVTVKRREEALLVRREDGFWKQSRIAGKG